jgi:transcriptional regulator with XRE-family HTH domain
MALCGMLIPVPLGEAIRQTRGRISQTKVAEAVGTDQPTVSRWESGEQWPSFEQVNRIEEFLGKPRGFLFIAAGYVDLPTSTLEQIRSDPALDPGFAEVLAVSYQAAVDKSALTRESVSDASPKARRS